MWKQPRFSCRLSFLLNKKKETRASFLPCYSSAQNSNTNFGSQWWSPSPHSFERASTFQPSARGRPRNYQQSRRFIDSSPKRRKIVNQIIFACKINGDADDNTRVVDSSPPSRVNTFKAHSKMSTRRWARSRGTILRRGGDRDSPLIDCGRKKKKGGGGKYKFRRVRNSASSVRKRF